MYSTGQNQKPDSWIVQLTLTRASSSPVWVRVQLKTKIRYSYADSSVKYSTKALRVSPQSDAPQSTSLWPGNKFIGYVPFATKDSDNIDKNYLYYQDLILSLDITVTHLESPIHATHSAAEAEADLGLPCFDLSMVMDDARRRDRYTDAKESLGGVQWGLGPTNFVAR